jgi:hypothetical protein
VCALRYRPDTKSSFATPRSLDLVLAAPPAVD